MKFVSTESFRWASSLKKLPSLVKSQKIYIFPNRFGILYLFVIVIMILTGATYSNNLIYLLGFFLFSVFVTSILQTHSNLNKVDFSVVDIEDAFEGDPVQANLQVKSLSKRTKQSLRAQIVDKNRKLEIPAKIDILPGLKTASTHLFFMGGKRGEYHCPRLKFYSSFPMGLFVAWSFHSNKKKYYIYPEPKNFFGFDASGAGEVESMNNQLLKSENADSDFREHRAYHHGESYRHIDWKAFARKRPLLVKKFDGDIGSQHVFDYHSLSYLPEEQRLQQMCYWIRESLYKKQSFQIVLPRYKSAMSSGSQHARACFRALATHSQEVASES